MSDKSHEELHEELMNDPERIDGLYSVKELVGDRARPRGILSDTDRQYLYDDIEYEYRQSDAKRRQNIRKRIENAILDFTILFERQSESEKQKIFDHLSLSESEAELAISYVISYMYEIVDRDLSEMESIIEDGIVTGERANPDKPEDRKIAECSTRIDIEYTPEFEELKQLLSDELDGTGPAISNTNLGVLIRRSDIDIGDIADDLGVTDRGDS